jgi:hypothetical protein
MEYSYEKIFMRFVILVAVMMVLWVVTPCVFVGRYQFSEENAASISSSELK